MLIITLIDKTIRILATFKKMLGRGDKTFSPSEEQKSGIIQPHLTGEIEGLIVSYRLFWKGKHEYNHGLEKISYEAFLLHARNLLEYITREKRRTKKAGDTDPQIDDSVLMSDHIIDREDLNKIRNCVLKIKNNYAKYENNRLAKQLSHISYDRFESKNQIQFDIKEIFEALKESFLKFEECAKNEYKLKIRW